MISINEYQNKEKESNLDIMNSVKLKTRNLNIVKGISMLFIIFLHVSGSFSNNVSDVVVNYLCLLFAGANYFFLMLVGYNLKKDKPKKHILKTYKTYLLPYIITAISLLIIFPAIHFLFFKYMPGTLNETKKLFFGYLLGIPVSKKIFFGIQTYESSVIWFLLVCFIGSNVVNLLLQRFKKVSTIFMFALAFAYIGLLLNKMGFTYFCISRGFMSIIYVYSGYIIKQRKISINRKTRLLMLIICLVVTILYGNNCNPFYDVEIKEFSIDLLISFLSGILIFIYSTFFDNIHNKFIDQLELIGIYTPFIMCVHSIDMNSWPWYLWSQGTKKYYFLSFILMFIVRLALINLCVLAIKYIIKALKTRGIKNAN